MARTTRATLAAAAAGVRHEIREYTYDPDADSIGMQAAAALGVSPSIVLKTLMTLVDGKPVCVLLASDCEVGMKRLAAAALASWRVAPLYLADRRRRRCTDARHIRRRIRRASIRWDSATRGSRAAALAPPLTLRRPGANNSTGKCSAPEMAAILASSRSLVSMILTPSG